MQATVISKKTSTTRGNFWEKNKSSRAGSKSRMKFWHKITPDYKKQLREIKN